MNNLKKLDLDHNALELPEERALLEYDEQTTASNVVAYFSQKLEVRAQRSLLLLRKPPLLNSTVGNSGVGKTSLAATLAVFYSKPELLPVLFAYRQKGKGPLPSDLAAVLDGMPRHSRHRIVWPNVPTAQPNQVSEALTKVHRELSETQRTNRRVVVTEGVPAEKVPFDLVDHPGQIELFNMMHLFFTTVCTSQLIVISLKQVLEDGNARNHVVESKAKEQALRWLQFVAGKRSPNTAKSQVLLLCTFCEEDRENLERGKIRIASFFELLRAACNERFPGIALTQSTPVGQSL